MRWFLAILLSCLTAQLAAAADLSMETTVHHRHVAHWRAYEHVVEVTIRPPSNKYVINGRTWTGASSACFGWAPKQRLHMIAGDWHGRCSTAIIRNVTLGRTCEMTCG